MSPTSSTAGRPGAHRGAQGRGDGATTLRLVWPQWRAAGRADGAPGVGRSGVGDAYGMGVRVLQMLLPEHDGPTEIIPVAQEPEPPGPGEPPGRPGPGGQEEGARGGAMRGIAALRAAREAIARHDPARILTLGGDSAVSVLPFTELAARYGPDLAVVWIDSHPDISAGRLGRPDPGYRAMALSHIIGTGESAVLDELPAAVAPSRVALAGLYSWTEEDRPGIATWGLHTFSPHDLSEDSGPLLEWLASTGCGRVAVHLDADTVDTAEGEQVRLGVGLDRGGLSLSRANRVVRDLDRAADVVGLTIAEYVPLQVVALARLLSGLPLV